MGFENLGEEPKKNTSLNKAALFASVLAFSAGEGHTADLPKNPEDITPQYVAKLKESRLKEGVQKFLLKESTPIDSSVLAWKYAGYVPEAWSKLSDRELNALIVHLNHAYAGHSVLGILRDNYVFGPLTPSKEFREMVRVGIIEMTILYNISDDELARHTWSSFTQATIYKIPRNKK
jgi:hypothetical protein